MKVFPVDSVVTTLGDDGLPVYDRPYVSADLRNVYSNFFSNGVFLNESTSLQVTAATGGMSVNVAAGSCHINGAFGVETEQKSFDIEAASASNDRIDTVVARLDLSIEERSLELYVIKGTASASPTRPSLTRNETVWELGLADVYVPKGATAIGQAIVTDTRLEDVRCGVVTPFAKLDTTSLFLQLQAATDEAVEAMKGALDGTTAGHLQTQIDETNATVETTKWLKPANEIPSGTDLDTLTEPGSWFCGEASSVTNAPESATGAFALYVYSVSGGGLIQELVSSSGRSWTRAVPGEWLEMTGPSMESYGELLWNGRIAEGGTLVIPNANRYGVMAVSYSSHSPVGLAMHYINTSGKHVISGAAGSSDVDGLSLSGLKFRSDDGVAWTADDLEILSLWGSGTTIGGQWGNEASSKTLTIWGVIPSPVTQRVV